MVILFLIFGPHNSFIQPTTQFQINKTIKKSDGILSTRASDGVDECYEEEEEQKSKIREPGLPLLYY